MYNFTSFEEFQFFQIPIKTLRDYSKCINYNGYNQHLRVPDGFTSLARLRSAEISFTKKILLFVAVASFVVKETNIFY